MRTITWLHISDLHTNNPRHGWEYDKVTDKLVADLERMRENHGLHPDFIFFTGDAAFGQIEDRPGQNLADQYARAREFLEAVRTTFGNNFRKEDMFIVPGNHDVNIKRHNAGLRAWLRDDPSLDEVHELIHAPGDIWPQFMAKLAEYHKFLRKYGCVHLLEGDGDGVRCPDRGIYCIIRELHGLKIAIAGLNSAWSSAGEGRTEMGRLRLGGERQLGFLSLTRREADFAIALMHHPVNWFAPGDNPGFDDTLAADFRFLLHGHEHANRVRPMDQYTRIGAGACYEHHDKATGYNFVRLNLDKRAGEVWLRRYTPDSGGGWIQYVLPNNRTDSNGMLELKASVAWIKNLLSPVPVGVPTEEVVVATDEGASTSPARTGKAVSPDKTRARSDGGAGIAKPDILRDQKTEPADIEKRAPGDASRAGEEDEEARLPRGISEVCALRDSRVTIGDSPTPDQLVKLMGQPYITAFRWSPDGSKLAAAWTPGETSAVIRIWETDDLVVPGEHRVFDIIGHKCRKIKDVLLGRIHDIAWSADGRELAVASSSLWFCDVGTTRLNDSYAAPAREYTSVWWDKHDLIAGDSAGHLHLINRHRHGPRPDPLEKPAHINVVTDIRSAPGENTVISCSAAFDIRVWDLLRGEDRALGDDPTRDDPDAEVAHELFVTRILLLYGPGVVSDQPRVVSVSGDSALKVWDLQSGVCNKFIGKAHQRAIRDASVSADYRFVATSSMDHSIKLWETRNWRALDQWKQRAHLDNLRFGLSFNPVKSHLLAVLCDHDSGIRILDLSQRFAAVCPHCFFDAQAIIQERDSYSQEGDFKCPCCEKHVFSPQQSVRPTPAS